MSNRKIKTGYVPNYLWDEANAQSERITQEYGVNVYGGKQDPSFNNGQPARYDRTKDIQKRTQQQGNEYERQRLNHLANEERTRRVNDLVQWSRNVRVSDVNSTHALASQAQDLMRYFNSNASLYDKTTLDEARSVLQQGTEALRQKDPSIGMTRKEQAGYMQYLQNEKQQAHDQLWHGKMTENMGRDAQDREANAEARINALKNYNNELKRQNKLRGYAQEAQGGDATYRTTANGQERQTGYGGKITGSAFNDPMYDLINKNEDAIFERKANASYADAYMGADDDDLQRMEDDEVAVFNALYSKDKKQAYDYIETLRPTLRARQAQYEKEEWSAFAKENPVFSSLISVPNNLMGSMVGLIGMGGAKLNGEEIDPNAGYMSGRRINNAIRGTVGQMAGEALTDVVVNSYGNDAVKNEVRNRFGSHIEKLGETTYGSVMSMLDNMFNVALVGGAPGAALTGFQEAASLALMSTTAMPDTIVTAKEHGLSDRDAFGLGVIAGVAEYFTEKVSLDALFDMESIAKNGFMKYLGRAALTEGSEEVASDFINFVAQEAIAGQNSDFNRTVKDYQRQGLSHEEAVKAAWADQVEQAAYSFIGGAIAGGGAAANLGAMNQISKNRMAEAGADIKAQNPNNAMLQRMGDVEAAQYAYDQQESAQLEQIGATAIEQAAEQMVTGGRETVNPALIQTLMQNQNALGMLEEATGSEEITDTNSLLDAIATYAENEGITASTQASPNVSTDAVGGQVQTNMPLEERAGNVNPVAPAAMQTAQQTQAEPNVQANTGAVAPANRYETTPIRQQTTQPVTSNVNPALLETGKTEAKKDADFANVHELAENYEKLGMSSIGVEIEKNFDIDNYNAVEYNKAANEIVEAALTGKEMPDTVLPVAMADTIYKTAKTEGSVRYGGQQEAGSTRLRGVSGRLYGEAAAQRGAGVAEGTGETYQAEGRTQLEAVRGQTDSELRSSNAEEKVGTPKSFGIPGGTNDVQLRTITNSLSAEEQNYSEALSRHGSNVTFFEGGNMTTKQGNEVIESRGLIVTNADGTREIYARRDHPYYSSTQIVSHEGMHDKITTIVNRTGKKRSAVVNGLYQELRNKYGAEFMDNFFLTPYKDMYEGTPLKAWEIMEELMSDLAGGMNELNRINPYLSESLYATQIQTIYETEFVNFRDDLLNDSGEAATANDSGQVFQSRDMIPDDIRHRLEEKGVTATPGGTVVRFSQESWSATDKVALKNNLIEAGFTSRSANKWIKDVNSIAATIMSNLSRYDYIADPYQSALKTNSEYYYTLDMSTLCKKRRLYQGTLNAIMHTLKDRYLTDDDLIRLRQLMEKYGYETPCGICYEESRKKNEQTFAERWMNGADNWPGYKNMEHDDPYIPRPDEFLTTDGRAELQRNHPEAYNSYVEYQKTRGQANPKISLTHTDYRGDILNMTDGDIKKVKHIGGLRVQSFSDFETPQLIDMMQAVMDMASRKLTSQAYTKVMDFARVFGQTGIKINLSLIGQVDENGVLQFDNKEGINAEEAFELRKQKGYTENVGTILVGANDASILAAWADPRIDMVIPFHKSGWKTEQYEKLGLHGYEDYTPYQSEKHFDKKTGKYISLKDAKKNEIYSEDYWDSSKTGRENAEAYLKLCAEKNYRPVFYNFLHDNGDGTWSLQKDGSTDGYWKSLVDFKMYPTTSGGRINEKAGVRAEQKEVVPKFNMEAAHEVMNNFNEFGDEDPNTLPVADDVVKEFVKEFRKKEKDSGVKHSRELSPEDVRKMDRDYMTAVENGDMETAQRMVDEAAKAAGWRLEHMFHGSLAYGFNVFDKAKALVGGNSGAGFYFSSSEDDSDSHYADIEGADNFFKAQNLAERIVDAGEWDGIEVTDYDKALEIAKKELDKTPGTYNVYLKYDNPYIRKWKYSTNIYDMIMEDYDESRIDRNDYDNEDDYEDARFEDMTEHLADKIYGAVYAAYQDMENNYEILNGPYIDNLVGRLADVAYDYQTITWTDIEECIAAESGITVTNDNFGTVAEASTEFTRAIIENFGFDAIEDHEVRTKFGQLSREMMDDTYHTIVFKPNQIKSAGPLTLDDNGEVIPLSKRFSRSNDIRYSQELNARYLELAKDPEANREEIQRMVEQAAREAGFDTLLYHGTSQNFTEFESTGSKTHAKSAKLGIWLSDSTNTARAYSTPQRTDFKNESDWDAISKNADRVMDEIENDVLPKSKNVSDRYFLMSNSYWNLAALGAAFKKYVPEEYEKLKSRGIFVEGEKYVDLSKDNYYSTDENKKAWNDVTSRVAELLEYVNEIFDYRITSNRLWEEVKLMLDQGVVRNLTTSGDVSPRIMSVYVNTDNFAYAQPPYKKDTEKVVKIRSAKRRGKDGIVFRWMLDGGERSTHYVVFNANRIKSADPVTYDDNGNVIPLSERFNPENQDIRYSQENGHLGKLGTLQVMNTAKAEHTTMKELAAKDTTVSKIAKDTLGNVLSQGQRKYFKNSKMVDENGNLKVMYHGTMKGGFSIFNPVYSKDGISLFFTDDREVAESYTRDIGETIPDYKEGSSGKTIYPVYLNITNPMIIDAKGHGWKKIPNGEAEVSISERKVLGDFAFTSGADYNSFNEKYDLENLKRAYEEAQEEGSAEYNGEKLDEWELEELYNESISDAENEYRRYYKNNSSSTITAREFFENYEDYGWYELEALQDTYDESGPTLAEIKEAADYDYESAVQIFEEYLNERIEDGELEEGFLDELSFPVIPRAGEEATKNDFHNTRWYAKQAAESGYDGVIIKDVYDRIYGSGRATVAIVFDSNQVKSVDNLNPTEDEDIRYSRELEPNAQITFPDEIQSQLDALAELREQYADLQKENKKNASRAEYFKGETKLNVYSKNPQLDTRKVDRAAKALVKDYGLQMELPELKRKLLKYAEDFHFGGKDFHDLAMDILPLANEIVRTAKVIVDSPETEILERIKKTKIKVSDKIRSDIPDYGSFRKEYFGIAQMSTLNGTPVEDFYRELQDAYGMSLFPDEVMNPTDQLYTILETASTLQPKAVSPFGSYELSNATQSVALDIMNDVMSMTPHKTFADKQVEARNRLKKQMQAQAEKAIQKVRESRDKRIQDLKDHYKEMAERKKQRKLESDVKTKLLKKMRSLEKLAKYGSKATQEQIQALIGDYDLTAKGITGEKIEKLEDMLEYVTAMQKIDPNFIPSDKTMKELDRLRKKRIADIDNIDDAIALTEILMNIENEIRTYRKLIDTQYKQDIALLGHQMYEDVMSTKGIGNTKFGAFNWFQQTLDRTVATPTLRPETEILRLVGFNRNSPMYQLMFGADGSLASGQRDMVRYQWTANKTYFDKFLNDRAFVQGIMGKNARACKITGKKADGTVVTLSVTPDLLMALYMHSKNDQNFKHFGEWVDENGKTQYGGGITIPDFKQYRKGNLEEAYRIAKKEGNLIRMTKTALKAAVEQLSDKEMDFIRAAQAYYSTMSQPEINKVSEKLVGYSIAKVENYFRINTDADYRGTNMDVIKNDGTIEGMGFTKERTGARNPILLISLSEQLRRDIETHSKYVGLAIPVRNFNKAFGINENSYDDQGRWQGAEGSVQSAIHGIWGNGALSYIQKLVESDIQNPTRTSEAWNKIFGKLRSFYAGSVLALNAGVAIKQAASYPTAAAEIGWMPLLKAFGNTRLSGKLNMDIVNKYSPLMYLRTQGMGYQEIADLKNLSSGWLNRALNSKALNWIQDIDVMTVKKLWKAAEYYVRDNFKDLEVGSEAYYRKVGEIHSNIIERTQPNYTTLQRGEILRSDSDLVRMVLGMFKTQPFQNFSILYEAAGELRAASIRHKADPNADTKAALKLAGKKFARAISSQLVASVVFAMMQGLWDWLRGKDDKYKDKDGNLTFASAFKQIAINMGANGFGMIPLGSVLYETIEAGVDSIIENNGGEAFFDVMTYGLDASTATGILNDMQTAVLNLINNASSVDLDSKQTTEEHMRKYIDAASTVAQAFGYPASNFIKDAQTVAYNAFRVLGKTEGMDKYMAEFYSKRIFSAVNSKSKGEYMDILYRAYDNGDMKSYNDLYKIYIKEEGLATKTKSAQESVDSLMTNHVAEEAKKKYWDSEAVKKAEAEAAKKNAESAAEKKKALKNAGVTKKNLLDYKELLTKNDKDFNGKNADEIYDTLMQIDLNMKKKRAIWAYEGQGTSLEKYAENRQKKEAKQRTYDSVGITESMLKEYKTKRAGSTGQKATDKALWSMDLTNRQREVLWDENGWETSFWEYQQKK